MSRDDEIGVKISLKDRAQFQKDVRDSAKDVEKFGDDARGAEEKSQGLFSKVAGGVMGVAKVAAKTGAALAAAFGGTAVTLGVQRLMQIEDATAKLDGLGHSAANVEQIMDNALASVRGTAFGLGDAATVAASVVATGVEPGEDLERTLKLIADTAQIAGTGIADMGFVFNKVLAKGKLGGDELMQLSNRGLPVLQWLQEELGKTAEEVQKMVSSGEIDFETFSNAVESNIAGAALKGGDTTRGAFANMFAAIGRWGALLAGPVFKKARDFFWAITDWVDAMEGQVEAWGERLGTVIGGAMDMFENFGHTIFGTKKRADPALEGLVKQFGGVDRAVETLGGTADDTSRSVGDSCDWMTTRLALLGISSDELKDDFSHLRDEVKRIYDYVRENTEGSWGRLQGVFNTLGGIVVGLATPFAELGVMIGESTAKIGVSTWEIFLTTLELLAEVLDKFIVPLVEKLVDFLGENQWIVDAAVASWVLWSVTTKGIAFGHLLWGLGVSTIALAKNSAAWVTNALISAKSMAATIGLLWLYAMDHLRAFGMIMAAQFRQAMMGMRLYAMQIGGMIRTVATTVWGAAVIVAKYVWMGIVAMASGLKMAAAWFIAMGPVGWVILGIIALVAIIIYYWDEIKAWTISTFNAIWEFIQNAWTWIKESATSVKDWIIEKWGEMLAWFSAIPGRISETASTMWQSVKDKTTEVKDWISEKFDEVIGFVKAMPGKITSAARGMWDGIKEAFRTTINWVIGKWNGLSFTTPSMNIPGMGQVGGSTVGVPQIPTLHTGGTVTGGGLTNIQPSEEIVMLPQAASVVPLPAGERVDPSIMADGDSRPMIAKVYLDRREIAEAVFEVAGDTVARR